MLTLTIQLAKPNLQPLRSGLGHTVYTAYDGHNAMLSIGNVSIAFDGRNLWEGEAGRGDMYQFGEYTDDPVRLNGVSCPVGSNVAERIMRALAADLGYSVSPKG